MMSLSKNDLEKLFIFYDEDGLKHLGFKEVLCCLSILLNGSI